AKGKSLGYEYIGITDHNPSVSGHTQAQIIDLIKKRTEVVQSKKRAIHVFNSLEIDIQPDGKRALPDSCLDLLDYACVSIHSSFRLNRKAMTDRVLAALDHPKVKFLAHPTGRLLGEREGVELDWDRIFDFCIKNNKYLEIDGWPNRLDLPDVIAKDAIKHGIKLVVDTDSHAAGQLVYIRYGVSVARRAWATKSDILNTLSLSEILRKII
ncbi:MAG: polymerase IV, family X protein, partial [Candidatus Azambacteria bacterium GW2011_GWA1_42_19]